MERNGHTMGASEQEIARLIEERHELFARLIELEMERTTQTMELFTMAAHELRTPLQSLLMATDMMLTRLRGSVDELPREWLLGRLEMQQHTLERMQELMQSWLCAPAVRAGLLPSVYEHFDLAELVRVIVARHGSDLSWSGSSAALQLEPVFGEWDRMRLDAVVSNLLSNAIKYGAGKPVTISVKRDKDDALIVVRDEGIGIAPEDLARIFDRFERASAPSRVPGFGIGLWMARALLRSIHGAITVESAPGRGSAFTVRLPLAHV